MKRAALASFALGAIVGCAAYTAPPGPQMYSMPVAAKVSAPLECWPTGAPMPERFGGMEVMAASVALRRAIIGRDGIWTLIEEIAPGTTCITGEGAQA